MSDTTEMLQRCRQGDPLAWEALVRRYQSRIYGLAFHYLRNPTDARDLAQEIFVQIYRRLDRFEGGAFVPWMLRLARNRCIDQLRRQKARPPSQDIPVEEGPDLPDDSADPEANAVVAEKKRLVHRAMGKLTDQNREIILLKEIQGLNFRETSTLLGVPVGTVKSRSHRARLELATKIQALDPAYARAEPSRREPSESDALILVNDKGEKQ